jgi:hypothetical protein
VRKNGELDGAGGGFLTLVRERGRWIGCMANEELCDGDRDLGV